MTEQRTNEAANAARFGSVLKGLGATFFWIGGLGAAIAYIANRHLMYEPALTYGLPALIAVVGVVVGALLRAAGYALRLQSEHVAATHHEVVLADR